MINKLLLLSKIVRISNKSKDNNFNHCMEEAGEVIVECSKFNRRQGRTVKLLEEMSDLLFQMLKILDNMGLDINILIDRCILKTREKFPEQIEEVENGKEN